MTEEEQAELYDEFTRPSTHDIPFRECCGVKDDAKTDVEIPCITGDCTVLYCRCGRSTESGYGSIGCRCQMESSGHWRVFERQMISTRKIALSTAKKRARRRRG